MKPINYWLSSDVAAQLGILALRSASKSDKACEDLLAVMRAEFPTPKPSELGRMLRLGHAMSILADPAVPEKQRFLRLQLDTAVASDFTPGWSLMFPSLWGVYQHDLWLGYTPALRDDPVQQANLQLVSHPKRKTLTPTSHARPKARIGEVVLDPKPGVRYVPEVLDVRRPSAPEADDADRAPKVPEIPGGPAVPAKAVSTGAIHNSTQAYTYRKYPLDEALRLTEKARQKRARLDPEYEFKCLRGEPTFDDGQVSALDLALYTRTRGAPLAPNGLLDEYDALVAEYRHKQRERVRKHLALAKRQVDRPNADSTNYTVFAKLTSGTLQFWQILADVLRMTRGGDIRLSDFDYDPKTGESRVRKLTCSLADIRELFAVLDLELEWVQRWPEGSWVHALGLPATYALLKSSQARLEALALPENQVPKRRGRPRSIRLRSQGDIRLFAQIPSYYTDAQRRWIMYDFYKNTKAKAEESVKLSEAAQYAPDKATRLLARKYLFPDICSFYENAFEAAKADPEKGLAVAYAGFARWINDDWPAEAVTKLEAQRDARLAPLYLEAHANALQVSIAEQEARLGGVHLSDAERAKRKEAAEAERAALEAQELARLEAEDAEYAAARAERAAAGVDDDDDYSEDED